MNARGGAWVAASCMALATWACDDGADDGARDPCAACGADERCLDDGTCVAVCMPPTAPRFDAVPVGTTLTFPAGVEVALTADDASDAAAPMPSAPDDAWRERAEVTLDAIGTSVVHARWKTRPAACTSDDEAVLAAPYRVVAALPGADAAGSAEDAVAADDSRIVGWASGWVKPVAWGSDLDAAWKAVAPALGPATGESDDAVSLGNGGALTFTFDVPISDRDGLDLAVFENGFSPAFLELGFVEVSSDGEHFARFASLSTQTAPVAAYGTVDAREVMGVAGRYAGGYGTGFDLAWLADDPAVLTGRVDLAAIAFVRVVDLVGDGTTRDAFGHPLYDPTPTFGPAGFDVEAIAVLAP